MHVSNKMVIAAVALWVSVGPVRAQPGDPPSSGKHAPSNAQVMSSPQVQSALQGALQVVRWMDGAGTKHKPTRNKPRQNHPAQSDAVRDAMSVARQAFSYTSSHPNATDAELKAQADAMMSGIFRREMGDGSATPTKPRSSTPARPSTSSSQHTQGHR